MVKTFPMLTGPGASHIDFNFPPADAAYSLLVGDALLPTQKTKLDASRVVHASIDPSVLSGVCSTPDDEDEGAEGDPDRIIVNARAARPADGLLSDDELEELIRRSSGVLPLTSVYDAGQRQLSNVIDEDLAFNNRVSLPPGRRGSFEPIYTSYTHVRHLSVRKLGHLKC